MSVRPISALQNSSPRATVREPGPVTSAFAYALRTGHAAQLICEAFLRYNAAFQEITRRAPGRFARREWRESQRDAVERIELYDAHVNETVREMRLFSGAESQDNTFWSDVKRQFAHLIGGLPDNEFCKTFFSSVSRRLFATVGVASDIEFVATDLDPLANIVSVHDTLTFSGQDWLDDVVRPLLESVTLETGWVDFDASVADVDRATRECLAALNFEPEEASIEVLGAVFYQLSRGYVIARIRTDDALVPLALALKNTANGVVVDKVMLTRADFSVLFSFARSYFHVDLERVADAVQFLHTLMPGKPVGELFTVLGRAKQGKTERYRSLMHHLATSSDRFVHATGERGLVMICFTLPSLDVIFKVIRDRIPVQKQVTREEVMDKYNFVFKHDRAGRLVDAQEFRRLTVPRNRFSAAVLEELEREASSAVHIDDEFVVLEHVYVERRVIPLNVYLRTADDVAANAAVLEYGRAIRDLACTDVFPGDLLLKNFGVTRHGRVIFYDYDELCPVTACRFREMPVARDDEDEMRSEPWFYVNDDDVFPETFIEFLSFTGAQREVFLMHHRALLTAAFWRDVQSALLQGELFDVVPYQVDNGRSVTAERLTDSPEVQGLPATRTASHQVAGQTAGSSL